MLGNERTYIIDTMTLLRPDYQLWDYLTTANIPSTIRERTYFIETPVVNSNRDRMNCFEDILNTEITFWYPLTATVSVDVSEAMSDVHQIRCGLVDSKRYLAYDIKSIVPAGFDNSALVTNTKIYQTRMNLLFYMFSKIRG